jgi:hypothetical protein
MPQRWTVWRARRAQALPWTTCQPFSSRPIAPTKWVRLCTEPTICTLRCWPSTEATCASSSRRKQRSCRAWKPPRNWWVTWPLYKHFLLLITSISPIIISRLPALLSRATLGLNSSMLFPCRVVLHHVWQEVAPPGQTGRTQAQAALHHPLPSVPVLHNNLAPLPATSSLATLVRRLAPTITSSTSFDALSPYAMSASSSSPVSYPPPPDLITSPIETEEDSSIFGPPSSSALTGSASVCRVQPVNTFAPVRLSSAPSLSPSPSPSPSQPPPLPLPQHPMPHQQQPQQQHVVVGQYGVNDHATSEVLTPRTSSTTIPFVGEAATQSSGGVSSNGHRPAPGQSERMMGSTPPPVVTGIRQSKSTAKQPRIRPRVVSVAIEDEQEPSRGQQPQEGPATIDSQQLESPSAPQHIADTSESPTASRLNIPTPRSSSNNNTFRPSLLADVHKRAGITV